MPKTCKHSGCTNFVFGGGYCKYHQSYRTDKVQKPLVKQSKPIRQVSKKQAILNQDYSKLRVVFLKENPLCKAKLMGCTGVATDVHHKRGRGVYLLRTDTWVALCRTCHQRVETHPDEAKALGLSESRLQNE